MSINNSQAIVDSFRRAQLSETECLCVEPTNDEIVTFEWYDTLTNETHRATFSMDDAISLASPSQRRKQ